MGTGGYASISWLRRSEWIFLPSRVALIILQRLGPWNAMRETKELMYAAYEKTVRGERSEMRPAYEWDEDSLTVAPGELRRDARRSDLVEESLVEMVGDGFKQLGPVGRTACAQRRGGADDATEKDRRRVARAVGGEPKRLALDGEAVAVESKRGRTYAKGGRADRSESHAPVK